MREGDGLRLLVASGAVLAHDVPSCQDAAMEANWTSSASSFAASRPARFVEREVILVNEVTSALDSVAIIATWRYGVAVLSA